jgi:predicted GIY-YIG superfamily endonuclease
MYIYKIDIEATGKSYIGKTTGTVEKRFAEHKASRNNSLISKAIKHYGGATVMQIYEAKDEKDLHFQEMEAIRLFNTAWPNGYNLVEGPGSGMAILKAKRERASKGDREPHQPAIVLDVIGNIIFKTQFKKRENRYLVHADQTVIKGTLRHSSNMTKEGLYYTAGSFEWYDYIVSKLGKHTAMDSQTNSRPCWWLTKEEQDNLIAQVLKDFN